MNREPVTSSNIASVGYDPDTQTLEVEFLKGGGIYQYSGVSEYLHQSLISASSVGKFFAANIKNLFPTQKVG